MDLTQKLFGSQRAVTIWVVSVVFAVVFPVYFSMMAASMDEGSGGSTGAKGQWQVEFVESDITSSETSSMSDGEQADFYFDLDAEEMIAYVEITVSCNDNDDPGPGFTDSVDASTDLSGVDGELQDETGSGSCNGDAIQFVIQVTPGYDGASYLASDVSKSDIEAQWDDQGAGRGEWMTSVTLDVSSPPTPLGGIVDDDEDVTVSWRAVTFTLSINAVAGEL